MVVFFDRYCLSHINNPNAITVILNHVGTKKVKKVNRLDKEAYYHEECEINDGFVSSSTLKRRNVIHPPQAKTCSS